MMTSDARNVLLIFGPISVGKMTVGQELARISDFHLLHAHQVIDLVTPLFPFGTPEFSRLFRVIQRAIIQEALGADRNLILTYIWNFDDPGNAQQVAEIDALVREHGGRLHFAELQAPLAVRLERNTTPNRSANKDVEWATPSYLAEWEQRHRTTSDGNFPNPDRHIVVDTSGIEAAETARRIKRHFGFG